jgi:hypothetical protein
LHPPYPVRVPSALNVSVISVVGLITTEPSLTVIKVRTQFPKNPGSAAGACDTVVTGRAGVAGGCAGDGVVHPHTSTAKMRAHPIRTADLFILVMVA